MKYHLELDIDLARNPHRGFYIAFEGIDGSGKTTQIKKLAQYLKSLGKKYHLTREPTRTTVVGKLIHHILQGRIGVPAVALQHLFAADRVSHVEEEVIPALRDDISVISDRCFWSAIPYGMVDRGMFDTKGSSKGGNLLLASYSILSMYHQSIVPDLTIYLDVSLKTSLDRLSKMKKTMEVYEKKEHLQKLIHGYEWLVKSFPREINVVDGERDIEEVASEIRKIVKTRFTN